MLTLASNLAVGQKAVSGFLLAFKSSISFSSKCTTRTWQIWIDEEMKDKLLSQISSLQQHHVHFVRWSGKWLQYVKPNVKPLIFKTCTFLSLMLAVQGLWCFTCSLVVMRWTVDSEGGSNQKQHHCHWKRKKKKQQHWIIFTEKTKQKNMFEPVTLHIRH